MDTHRELMTLNVERAMRWASVCHRGQSRKGSDTPYIEHVFGVALILDRAGFDEDVVIAGLLHDVVEDTEATLDQVEEKFGAGVAQTVAHCTEIRVDAQGHKRPWIERKRDHLAAMAGAPASAWAVILADKLHNLLSIELDLRDGRLVWSLFNAERAAVLWYYRMMIDQLGRGNPRLEALAGRCREALAVVEGLGGPDQKNG